MPAAARPWGAVALEVHVQATLCGYAVAVDDVSKARAHDLVAHKSERRGLAVVSWRRRGTGRERQHCCKRTDAHARAQNSTMAPTLAAQVSMNRWPPRFS